jgi:hypothetical protein
MIYKIYYNYFNVNLELYNIINCLTSFSNKLCKIKIRNIPNKYTLLLISVHHSHCVHIPFCVCSPFVQLSFIVHKLVVQRSFTFYKAFVHRSQSISSAFVPRSKSVRSPFVQPSYGKVQPFRDCISPGPFLPVYISGISYG